MTESDFDELSEQALEQLQRALEASGVDFEEKGDGVLELEFDDGSKIVVNRHRAAKEIWVAARSGGFHFRWEDESWRDTRQGGELFATLSRLVSSQGGSPVVLSPARGA